jgi:hypothetical protein
MTRNQLFRFLERVGAKFDIGESFEGVQHISVMVKDVDFGNRHDWGVVRNLANPDGYIIIHKKWGYEWQDTNKDFIQFNTEKEADCYLDGFFTSYYSFKDIKENIA